MLLAAREVILKNMKARFNEINSTEELNELFQQSNEKPVVLFKHSLTCPISSGVYQEISNADADINLIVMQRARNVSTALAEKSGIRHESPQAMVIKNGKPVYHASHYDVTASDVEESLKN
ncbi:bacillithiol system redox-active protein YtxJ [soil metagenome]